jgi:hypothetical protein
MSKTGVAAETHRCLTAFFAMRRDCLRDNRGQLRSDAVSGLPTDELSRSADAMEFNFRITPSNIEDSGILSFDAL